AVSGYVMAIESFLYRTVHAAAESPYHNRPMTRPDRLLAALILVSAASTAVADDWPHWRGPARNGISSEKAQPWSLIKWKAEVGTGFSSMAVSKGRLVTLGNANDTDTVYCLDAEKGDVLWKHSYPSDLGDKYFEGGTTHTPAIDGDRVYTIGRWGDAFCFDLA